MHHKAIILQPTRYARHKPIFAGANPEESGNSTMTNHSTALVQKLWNYCNILRDGWPVVWRLRRAGADSGGSGAAVERGGGVVHAGHRQPATSSPVAPVYLATGV